MNSRKQLQQLKVEQSMSKRVVIVGAGGFGRGVHSWLMQSPRHREAQDIGDIVFIDDATPNVQPEVPVISTVSDYVPEDHDEVLVAVGMPQFRRKIVESLEGRDVQFHTFIDDRAILAENVHVGTGTVICPGTVISAHATVGSHVHINFNCSIGHDTVLGEFTTLSPMSNIMGETLVGSDVFVGGSAVVLPRIEIANETTIGAGSTVIQPVNSASTVVGNPARYMGLTQK